VSAAALATPSVPTQRAVFEYIEGWYNTRRLHSITETMRRRVHGASALATFRARLTTASPHPLVVQARCVRWKRCALCQKNQFRQPT
jgi:hypothetical protein